MAISLKTKISVFVTAVIIAISIISTYLFTAAHSRSKEKGRVSRGEALNYALSKAAEEGLIHEDLDLIKKAANIVQADDVVLAQVYSTIWEAIDAFPFEKLKELPAPDAVDHFKRESSPLYIRDKHGYDFYNPILLKISDDSPPVTIGFVRIILSSSSIQKEIKEIVIMNIIASAVITLFAILAINILISKLVLKPVMNLHRSVSVFKNNALPGPVPVYCDDEIGELSSEFNKMSKAVKERTEKLIDSEKRVKNLFDRVEHAIFGLDKDGDIIEANDRFKEMFGTVKSLCNLLMSEQRGVDCLTKALSGKLVQIEEKALGKNGDELTVLLSIYPEIDGSGNIEGYDGYIIDITEKKRLEERLIRAQKMEAVGTLAGGIAHDFNNILTAVLGYAELIKEKITPDNQLWKAVDIIEKSAKKGASLANRILNITKKETLELKAIDINAIITETVEILIRSIPKDISVELRLEDGLSKIKADPTQIQQVIMNLAINSRDAMPDGGVLRIGTSKVGKENGGANGISSNFGFIRLSVSDTGKGIDKDMQIKVFDPFFTTKKEIGGTGLGLYIVHSIVAGHGGYINLYSEPDKGTRFNIYFPVSKNITETFKELEREDLTGSGLVLVIDDENNIRELARDLLEPLGYKVITAADGFEGLNIFREQKGNIKIIILDMIMPKMNGTEVFQSLQTMDPDVKVILCSGYTNEGLGGIKDLLNTGAKGFVQKPFTKKTIAKAIKDALS